MSTLQNNIASLEALITKANALPEEKTIQSSKTVTPTTSSQTVKPDSGYDGMGQVVVNAIPDEYIDTTDATATRNHIISGYTAYVNGSKITGAIPQQSSSALTASGAKVSVPMGYYPYPMSKSITTTTMLTPSISVGDDGVITASARVSTSGYVAAGTKTGTAELDTQAATTITPTKSSQTAVDVGKYTTGVVTVAAIPDKYVDTTDSSAAADDIVTGETAYVNGVKVTGTNPYEKAATDTEVAAQATQIEEIMGLLDGKSVPGGSTGVETCTVEILALGPTITTNFYFIDTDGAVQFMECSPMDLAVGVQLVVKGNTPLVGDINISSIQEPEGGAIRIGSYCYYITGDATVYVGG